MHDSSLLRDLPELEALPTRRFDSNRKRFQSGLDVHLPLIVLDAAGNIQHLTPAARGLLEYKPGQSIEPCFFSHVHGKNLYQVMRDVADMVCRGKAQASWLLRLRTGQNRWRWYKATARNELMRPEATLTVHLRDFQEG